LGDLLVELGKAHRVVIIQVTFNKKLKDELGAYMHIVCGNRPMTQHLMAALHRQPCHHHLALSKQGFRCRPTDDMLRNENVDYDGRNWSGDMWGVELVTTVLSRQEEAAVRAKIAKDAAAQDEPAHRLAMQTRARDIDKRTKEYKRNLQQRSRTVGPTFKRTRQWP
jgi:hypothetical protein